MTIKHNGIDNNNQRLKNVAETAAYLAHDLKRPLRLMQMLLSAIEDGENDHQFIKEAVQNIETAAAQINNTIDDMRELSSESNNSGCNIKLADLLTESLDLSINELAVSGRMVGTKVSYQQNCQDVIKGDFPNFKKAFQYLLVSAMRILNYEGEIKISSITDKQNVKVEIIFPKGEITEAVSSVMFDPLYKNNQLGISGLRLAWCKRTINTCEGQLIVNHDREHLIFKLDFPIGKQVLETEEVKKIVVIDSNKQTVEDISKIINEAAYSDSHKIVSFNDYKTFANSKDNHEVNIILLSYELVNNEQTSIIHELKSRLSSIPIYILSSCSINSLELIEQGVTGVKLLPLSKADLVFMIENSKQ